jgi:putative transposase
MDFFTVPTLTFPVLYCFFIIEHGRRKILHFNVTEHPTGPWIVQQRTIRFPPPSCTSDFEQFFYFGQANSSAMDV